MFAHLNGAVVRTLLIPVLWLGLSPHTAMSQAREILFSQVSVSEDDASLLVELDDGEELSIALSEGRVVVDGVDVGAYTPGGTLETEWRALLDRAVAVNSGELRELLSGWSVPVGVSAQSSAAADAIQERIAGTIRSAAAAPVSQDPGQAVGADGGGDPGQDSQDDGPTTAADLPPGGPRGDSLLAALIRRTDRLRELAAGLEDVDLGDLDIHLDDRVEIEAGETVDGSILLVDGSLAVDGTVDGDVILLGGRLEMGPEGRILGSVRSAGGRVSGDRDGIAGAVVELDELEDENGDLDEAIREAVRERTREVGWTPFGSRNGAFRNFTGGLVDLLQNLVTFGLLLVLGLGVLYFFPRQFEVVSRTAGHSAGQSLLVGLAGLVLAFPVYILGIVFLAVSIIGIPLLLAWVPLFPFALALAVVFGLLAVARNLGRWASGHRPASMDGFDSSRPAVQVGWGLAVILVAYVFSNLFEMGGPWFGLFEGVLLFVGSAITTVVICVGLGAFLLSRGGRDRTYAAPRPPKEPEVPGGPDVG